jgi:alanine dehydrogenase
MVKIGLIREGKVPADNRVALTPGQCKWIKRNYTTVDIVVQSAANRCFSDREYQVSGIEVKEDLTDCDILLGIKEVPVHELIDGKTYLFFSHTKKKQPHNRILLKSILEKKIRLVDYECLEHEDGQRIIGFGFFAGIVGAHNGMMAYGYRTGLYQLGRVYEQQNFRKLIHTYFGLRLPPVKIAVTGSGRVASGILEIMNLLGIIEVEADEFLQKQFAYPVYVHLKGTDLYAHKETGRYNRDHFHAHPEEYLSLFHSYTHQADILMNGIYWDTNIPRLFEWEHMREQDFRIQTIADVTDDTNGSVPCNIADGTIEHPVYGVDIIKRELTLPYQQGGIDVMAVGNLPNELPRDASRYFGEQLIKYVLGDLIEGGSPVIERATIAEEGRLGSGFVYLKDYVSG